MLNLAIDLGESLQAIRILAALPLFVHMLPPSLSPPRRSAETATRAASRRRDPAGVEAARAARAVIVHVLGLLAGCGRLIA